MWLDGSEAEVGDEVSALVADDPRTFDALERRFGVLVPGCRRLFVIGLGGARVLGAAASLLREGAHALERARVALRGGLFEQRPRRGVVRRPADPFRRHQSQTVLR